MKNPLIFVIIVFTLYLIGFAFKETHYKVEYEFMSFAHSNSYRAVAALIIMLQHVVGSFDIRYLTPLGGIGVAIFLISSGYGLNESYKRRGIRRGDIGSLKLLEC